MMDIADIDASTSLCVCVCVCVIASVHSRAPRANCMHIMHSVMDIDATHARANCVDCMDTCH